LEQSRKSGFDDRNVLLNPHERAILETFLEHLVRVRGAWKIREAEAMIQRAIERQPDAAYLLVQRSLMLGNALERSKARLAKYELATLQAIARASVPERSQASPRVPASALSTPLPAVASAYSSEPLRGCGTSFLDRAAATAAGIAGEAFLVQGLENLIDDYVVQ
jgi:hypothetical protein